VIEDERVTSVSSTLLQDSGAWSAKRAVAVTVPVTPLIRRLIVTVWASVGYRCAFLITFILLWNYGGYRSADSRSVTS
jgi:hypothetical protein